MAGERDLWLSRYAALRVACGAVPEYACWARDKAASYLVVLTLDEAVLFQARLNDVRMLYVGFAFRGEVAYGCSGGKTVFGYEQPASMFVRQAASG
ncbi:hypothetical protein [uncultured Acidovorax sp.]|uniref:hypothetical protein n=1 Tax=uncultured Acidovorax sp. TaxID=158751 RepID=UPI00258F1BCB|nr:hypothetical protein [uncultured Acidovorax sp.]